MREKEKDKERQREREKERGGGIEIQSFISLFIKRLFERGRENIKWYLRERERKRER